MKRAIKDIGSVSGVGLSLQRFASLIHANLRETHIVRQLLDREDILHMIDKGEIGLWWDAPTFLRPRLEFVTIVPPSD